MSNVKVVVVKLVGVDDVVGGKEQRQKEDHDKRKRKKKRRKN